MNKNTQRREFFKLSIATGCAAALCKPAIAAGPSCEEDIKKAERKTRDQELTEKINLLKTVRQTCGNKVVQATEQYTVDKIREKFAARQIEFRDLSAVKSLLWNKLDKDKFTFEKVADTGRRLEYRVTRCHLADTVRALGEPELAYALICAWDVGFCRGLNPDIKFTRTKTLINGDDYCNHRYELQTTLSRKST